MDVSGNASMSLTDLQSHVRVRRRTAIFDRGDRRRRGDDRRPVPPPGVCGDAGGCVVREPARCGRGGRSAGRDPAGDHRKRSHGLYDPYASRGCTPIPEADVVSKLGLQPGTPFFVNQLAIDRDAVQLRLRQSRLSSRRPWPPRPGLSADGTSADVVFGVREGPQIFVDHVLIVGNERTQHRNDRTRAAVQARRSARPRARSTKASAGSRRSDCSGAPGSPSSPTATRRKRDVLVTVEEAPATTVGYGGGFEVGQFLSDRCRRRGRHRADRVRAARVLRDRPAQSVRQEPLGQSVHRASACANRVPTTHRLGRTIASLQRYRVLGTFREPRVFGTPRRRGADRHDRAAGADQLQFCAARRSAPNWRAG